MLNEGQLLLRDGKEHRGFAGRFLNAVRINLQYSTKIINNLHSINH